MSARVSPFLPSLLCALLAACGGGGTSAMPAANNEPASAVVLYRAQFADPFTDVQTLVASITPAPPAGTAVS